MGIVSKMQKRKQEYLKQRKETEGYRRIVAEKTKLARRQAYADEAVKVAREKARLKAREEANRPTLGQRIGAIAVRATTPRPVARPIVRRVAKRRSVRSVAPKRRSVKKQSYAKKFVRAEAQAQKQVTPANLNQAIYGGY